MFSNTAPSVSLEPPSRSVLRVLSTLFLAASSCFTPKVLPSACASAMDARISSLRAPNALSRCSVDSLSMSKRDCPTMTASQSPAAARPQNARVASWLRVSAEVM